VVVAAVADEAHASLGVREALRAVDADAAIVTEPTGLDVVVAHFGPGGEGAHADVEWVSIDDTVTVTETLLAVAGALCA
jgi:acetylornithine deacetylase/succinyl-diaminopimelate desuccinylase-like protein